MSFYVSNYHSKKSLSKAIAAGAKIKIHPVPLTKEQLKQNANAKTSGVEPPHTLLTPMAYHSYEIQGSFNKQVPFWTATVILDIDCNILKVE